MMSLVFTMKEGWIVSHLQYLNKIYEKVINDNGRCNLAFDNIIFEINSLYLRQNQILQSTIYDSVSLQGKKKRRKRSKLLPDENLEEINHIKRVFDTIISAAKINGLFYENISSDNNRAARLASQKFYRDTYCDKDEFLYGSNNTNDAIISEINNKKYVFPKRSIFYCYDIGDIGEKMELNNQYDFILLDPPWWNKSIRRKKPKYAESSYKMLYNKELLKIPIRELLHSNGIVAIWCTNAPSHLSSISNEIFPSWGITYRAKWYWIKVTQTGDTVCNINSALGKQPFELLILGSVSKKSEIDIPDGKLLVSVPSAIHSHKPPLTEVIKEYLPKDPKCLEIFARYLLPGWTSWGLEVLKFQHLSLYKIVNENNKMEINIDNVDGENQNKD